MLPSCGRRGTPAWSDKKSAAYTTTHNATATIASRFQPPSFGRSSPKRIHCKGGATRSIVHPEERRQEACIRHRRARIIMKSSLAFRASVNSVKLQLTKPESKCGDGKFRVSSLILQAEFRRVEGTDSKLET